MVLRSGAKPGYYRLVISGIQCRAGRALLGMTQIALARAAGVSVLAIKRFERGSDPRASTVNAIERVLTDAGVLMIDNGALSAGGGPGVRLAQTPEYPRD